LPGRTLQRASAGHASRTRPVQVRSVPCGPTVVRSPRRAEIAACLEDVLRHADSTLLTPRELGLATSAVAARRQLWEDLVERDHEERWFAPLFRSATFDLWLLAWEAGQATEWHDHGGSSGSFAVGEGRLFEQFRRPRAGWIGSRYLPAGRTATFGPAHVHLVTHGGGHTAVSIHGYSPPLVAMTFYQLTPYGLSAVETLAVDSPEPVRQTRSPARKRQAAPAAPQP
jgi:hypothetical protein